MRYVANNNERVVKVQRFKRAPKLHDVLGYSIALISYRRDEAMAARVQNSTTKELLVLAMYRILSLGTLSQVF